MFMNIQFSSILFLTTMQTAPHSISHLSQALPCTLGSSRRTLNFQIPQNSNTVTADNTSIPPMLNQEDHNQLSLHPPNAPSSDRITKLTFQQQNGVETREQVAAKMISISRCHLKDGRGRKKYTIGGQASTQDHPKNSNGEGFSTSRSIPQDRSLSKLSSDYLEASIREEEEIFKKIQEKALLLKQKQKKGRQILKKIIKQAVQKPQNLTSSLYAIPPIKSKFAHRRGQSCDFPIPQQKHSSDILRSLDQVNSQKQEDEGDMSSILGKSSEAVEAFGYPSPSHMSLQEQLNLEKKMKEKLVEEHHQAKSRLQGQLTNALQQCRKSQQIITGLEKQKAQIQYEYTKQIEQLSLYYRQQLTGKEKQIVQLTTIIQQQTIKLQQIQQRYDALATKQEKNTKALEILQKQNKTRNQEYNQGKRRLQKQLAQLTEDRRKSQQSYLREMQAMKQKIEAQSIEQKLLIEKINNNNKETNRKQEQQLQATNKENIALKNSLKNLNIQIAQLNETVSKLITINQEKEQARKTLQQYLLNAEDHIRKVEEKYHLVSRELTEKNVAYDFLWIQLQEAQKTSINGEKAIEPDPHLSLLQSSENDSPAKQEERDLNRILSSSTLKDIKDLKGIMQQGERQGRSPSQHKIRMSLPLSHRPSLNMPILVSSQCSADDAILEEIEPDSSKKQTGNIILKTQLSEAFSQQNDQMQEMLSNHNSNTSKMQSSVGAFSQYSRIKSTQSALSHKQVEQEYQNKMKNNKMMAKLGKFKPKK